MYAEITDGKVTKIVSVGGSYKNISFGKLAEDKEYFDAGLYKLIDVAPTVTEYQRLGGEVIEIDEASRTVTRTKNVLDMSTEEIYTKNIKKINREYESAIAQLTAGVPDSEKGTWSKQEAEARAYVANNTVSTPLIDGIATARGVDKVYLIGKIIEKADAYTIAIAQLTGERQAKEDQLNMGEL
ncbi:MAG TPA: hypothetical protein CFH81_00435 [Sulfurovum sp. UBA12169]|nr:MAG TPA: hypothetical protein CFH81_00435 [Sulfurovum sp. UBA12169]